MDPIKSNAFKQSVVGSYASGATDIELASISSTVTDPDYLPDPANGNYNGIFFNTAFGGADDANNNGAYMIGRVTAINYTTNTVTITTAQEDTADVAMDSAWVMLYGATKKVFNDIFDRVLDVRDYGAEATAGFDSTSAFQAMADALGYINIPYTTVPFEIDNITTTKQTVVNAIHGYASIKARTPATLNNPVFVFDHANSGIHKGVHIDGDSTSRSLVRITADNCFAYITGENVTADADSTTYTSGIEVTGNNCRFDIDGQNFSNTGQSNLSVPRLVSIQGTSDRYFGSATGKTIQCGVIVGSSTIDGEIERINVEDATDNGLYHLGGSTDVGSIVYKGDNEGIVVSGDLRIGKYTINGGGITGIGLNDANGNLRIGELELVMNGTESLANIMRTRSGAGFGNVQIDSVRGRMRGNVMFNLGNALAVDSLTLGSVNVDYEYDAAVTGFVSQWCNFEDVDRFHINNFRARIIDVNNVLTNENFLVRLPTVSLPSQIYYPIIEIFDSDETTESSATYSITNTSQNNLDYRPYSGGTNGTYIATITPSTSGTVTLKTTSDTLSYRKIGDEYTVYGSIQVDTVSSPVGNFYINLPSTLPNSVEYQTAAAVNVRDVVSANISDFVPLIIQNSNRLEVYLGDSTSLQSDSAQQLQANTSITIFAKFISA